MSNETKTNTEKNILLYSKSTALTAYIKLFESYKWLLKIRHLQIEPHREKTGFLPMRKQRRRSASQ